MLKLVTKQIIKVIKVHVFPNGENIQIHCKTIVFEGLTGCVCTENVSKPHTN